MNEKTVELIRQLTEKVGVEGARLWPHMVAYTWAVALSWIISAVALAILTTIVAMKLEAHITSLQPKEDDRYDEHFEDRNLFKAAKYTIIVLFGLATFVMICVSLPNLIEPEGSTIRAIMSGLK